MFLRTKIGPFFLRPRGRLPRREGFAKAQNSKGRVTSARFERFNSASCLASAASWKAHPGQRFPGISQRLHGTQLSYCLDVTLLAISRRSGETEGSCCQQGRGGSLELSRSEGGSGAGNV
jgi:hypothetical protein